MRHGHDEQVQLWERILSADECFYAYFADRADLPGAVLFTAERPDAPEFDLALIDRVADDAAELTLSRIDRHFREHRRTPRIRLTPRSTPGHWPAILRHAGFHETDGRHVYLLAPETFRPPTNPAIRIERVVTPDDADLFSAIQVAAFGIAPEHRAWDRDLARRHLAVGERIFYLAWLDGQAVGAAMSTPAEDGTTLLSGLATLPDARRQGVATSLLRRRVDDARNWGSTTIFSTALADGYPARLYERLGFIPLFAARTFAP